MGELLHFPNDRTDRRSPAAQPPCPPAFYFDVSCPFSYLTAERVERALGEVEWVVVDGSALERDGRRPPRAAVREQAEARARALRLPLLWPDGFGGHAPRMLRATAFACELGAGAAFALAASRLAFCGGFDLEDPETIAEAAAAAAIPLAACLEAARDAWRDEELRETARSLATRGIDELPAFSVGDQLLQGETGLLAAGVLLQDGLISQRPLAPVG
jgi:2-hydroxychromene-2-carboxylate isomerase